MGRPPRVLIIVQDGGDYQTRILAGIFECARPLGWHFRKLRSLLGGAVLRMIEDWKPDGAIVVNPISREQRQLLKGIPWIQVGGQGDSQLPYHITYENVQLGRVGGEFLLHKGIRSAVALGNSRNTVAQDRVEGFLEVLRDAGVSPYHEVDELQFRERTHDAEMPWISPYPPLMNLLRELPKPVGLFGWQDKLCEWILEHCLQNGIAVPDDVLVLGVNNSPMICEMTYPPLSSVKVPFHLAGLLAAQRLNLLMQGQSPPRRQKLDAMGIEERASTLRSAEPDELVTRLLHLLEKPGGCTWSMAQLCEELGCGRRILERRVRQGLNRSVLDLKQDARLNMAQQLLMQDVYSIEGVAQECGFQSVRSLQKLFLERMGCSPSQYRRRWMNSVGENPA